MTLRPSQALEGQTANDKKGFWSLIHKIHAQTHGDSQRVAVSALRALAAVWSDTQWPLYSMFSRISEAINGQHCPPERRACCTHYFQFPFFSLTLTHILWSSQSKSSRRQAKKAAAERERQQQVDRIDGNQRYRNLRTNVSCAVCMPYLCQF